LALELPLFHDFFVSFSSFFQHPFDILELAVKKKMKTNTNTNNKQQDKQDVRQQLLVETLW